MYNTLLTRLSGLDVFGLTAAYGADTGPKMSKTSPTGFKFSSTTVSPIFGVFSTLTIMFLLELI